MFIETMPGYGYDIEKISDTTVQLSGRTYRVDNADEFIRFYAGWALLPMHMSREQYEAACATYGVEAVPDDRVGRGWGDFDIQTYFSTAERRQQYGIPHTLNQRRAFAINSEREQAAAPSVPVNVPVDTPTTKMSGQLWEQCRQCGAEPVYMPLHLCEKCWPKN